MKTHSTGPMQTAMRKVIVRTAKKNTKAPKKKQDHPIPHPTGPVGAQDQPDPSETHVHVHLYQPSASATDEGSMNEDDE